MHVLEGEEAHVRHVEQAAVGVFPAAVAQQARHEPQVACIGNARDHLPARREVRPEGHEQLPAAQAFVNVSNDAWFGESFAADQHLQSSQMRALETGRWMVRATNTGASAAIDPSGRVVTRLAPFTAGTLVATIEPRGGLTPYARWGNVPAVVLALLLVVIARRRGFA